MNGVQQILSIVMEKEEVGEGVGLGGFFPLLVSSVLFHSLGTARLSRR